MRKTTKTNKKPLYYALTLVSTCLEGQDIHTYIFEKKTLAQDYMRSQYVKDKEEIKKNVRISTIDRNGYEVYESGRFAENHLVAKIIPIYDVIKK